MGIVTGKTRKLHLPDLLHSQCGCKRKYSVSMRGLVVLCVVAMATRGLADCDCEDRIAALEAVVNNLGRGSCQTGTLRFVNCDTGFENITNAFICASVPISGGAGVSESSAVTFGTAFTSTPVVSVSLSGASILQGQNQSVSVSDVSTSGLTINYEADDYLPIVTDLTWFACPGPALSNSDPVLGPGNNGGGSSGGDSRRR